MSLVPYNSSAAHKAALALEHELALERARTAKALTTTTSFNALPLTTLIKPRATEVIKITTTKRNTHSSHQPSRSQVTVTTTTSSSSSRTSSSSTRVEYRREERRVERAPARVVSYRYYSERRIG
jgi:hypothetical protein